ncbi:hypothetical protein GBAR_LOCUS3685, partial [Geodia barretti]
TAPQSAFGAGYARPLECLLSYGSYQQNVSSRTMDSHLAVGTARPRERLRFSREDVFQHRTREDCWIILYGEVYNVTAWLRFLFYLYLVWLCKTREYRSTWEK